MKMIRFVKQSVFVLSGLVACSVANAAVQTVPAQHANILNAFNAANSGDEIRVRKDYVETETDLDLVGKNVTIRSYSMDYSTPESGAKWIGTAVSDIYGKMAQIENGSITIEGFSELTGTDCNVFQLGGNSAITVRDCILSGTRRADTAAFKAVLDATRNPSANNVSITIENTTATANGRVIWMRDNTGTTNLTIKNSVFEGNSSYIIMAEPETGTHNVDITDCCIEIPGTATQTRGIRFLMSQAAAGSLITGNLNFERNYFHSTSTGRGAINVRGINSNTYDAASTLTTTIRNCVFDLTNGADTTDNVAYSSDTGSDNNNNDVKMDHCTIVLNGTNKSGVRQDELLGTLEVSNCIFEGDGAGFVAFRIPRGTIISNKNLVNVAGKSGEIFEKFAAGTMVLSGDEIIGESAQFTNLANKDFTLAATSPALGAGEDLGITADILGNVRPNPNGTLPDLGAYERGVNPASVNDWAVY